MNKKLIFLNPVFKEMIWGGNRLRTDFGYDIPSEKTGECWAVAAHQNGDCTVKGGVYNGKKLSELWNQNRELFGNLEGERFPLLIKIIDAKDDLSIQVHPNDEYANIHENGSFGKTECWYILDCDEDATIVIGHNAKNKQELTDMINQKRWGEFIREIPIKKGDFFQIEPGCLHAIKKGTLLLETQQNSDITYRVYDYDRLQNGKPRELHVKQSIDVINAPFSESKTERTKIENSGIKSEKLVECKYYTVEKVDIISEAILERQCLFMNVSIIDGCGEVDGVKVKKGDHFIVPNGYGEMTLSGTMSMILSYV